MEQIAIDAFTMVPLGAAVLAIGGSAAWLTRLSSKQERHDERLKDVEDQQKQYNKDISYIRSDLAEIKGELKNRK